MTGATGAAWFGLKVGQMSGPEGVQGSAGKIYVVTKPAIGRELVGCVNVVLYILMVYAQVFGSLAGPVNVHR